MEVALADLTQVQLRDAVPAGSCGDNRLLQKNSERHPFRMGSDHTHPGTSLFRKNL